MSILSVGLSGLLTSRDALSVTSSNVANANNPAYKRQVLKQASGLSQFLLGGYVGQGVQSTGVDRVTNQFLYNQILKTGSESHYASTLKGQLSRVDEIFADGNNALADAMTAFTNAAQDLSLRPADNPSRQQFLSSTQFLVEQFNSVSGRFDAIRRDNTEQIQFTVNQINDLTGNIADLNKSIAKSYLTGDGKGVPLNLLDQREDLILQLSEKVDVQVIEGERGELNILMRQGQPLVTFDKAYSLLALSDASDPETTVIARDPETGGAPIRFANKNLGRGELSALLEFRDTAINQYQNTLGLMALSIHDQVNAIQAGGVELVDDPGPPAANVPGKPLLSFAKNTSDPLDNGFSRVVANAFNSDANTRLAVGTVNTSTLQSNEYEVFVLNNAGTPEVRYRPLGSKSAGQVATDLGGGNYQVPDAFTFSISGGAFVPGDSFQVKLTAKAALNLRLENLGTDQVATRAPSASVGDNTQVLKMTRVFDQATLFQRAGSSGISVRDTFSRLLTTVGNDVRVADNSAKTSLGVLESLNAEQSAQSGVNLDEEAAKLIQYQQAYSANAKIISLSKELFDDLLTAVR